MSTSQCWCDATPVWISWSTSPAEPWLCLEPIELVRALIPVQGRTGQGLPGAAPGETGTGWAAWVCFRRQKCSQAGLPHLTPKAPPCSERSRSYFHEAPGAVPVPPSVIRDQQHEAIASPTMTQQLPLLPSSLQQGITEAKIIWKNIFPWNCAPVSPPVSTTLSKKPWFLTQSQAHLLDFLILFASIKVTLLDQIQQHQITKESSLQRERTCALSWKWKRKCSDLVRN